MSLSLNKFFVVTDASIISLMANSIKCRLSNLNLVRKEAPLCTSKQKASYTLEASVVLPISLFIIIFIVYFFRVLYVGYVVDYELTSVAREYSVAVTSKNQDISALKWTMLADCNKRIASHDYINNSISGSVGGISYRKSDFDHDYIDIQASYKIKNLITFFGGKYVKLNSSGVSRKWIGYDPNEENDSQFVYITKYGKAYHESLSCPYLKPSIQTTDIASISDKRNIEGAKYYSCPLCKGSRSSGIVYITNYGNSYHSSITCSGLKRTIQRIKKKNARGYHACSKCCGDGG